jgi:hypothetical protein
LSRLITGPQGFDHDFGWVLAVRHFFDLEIYDQLCGTKAL